MCSGTSQVTTDLATYTDFHNQYHEILEFYYDGVKAAHEKSKFFHWYLIIEYLEHSMRYRNKYADSRLFSGQDLIDLESFSGQFSNASLRSSILSLKHKKALKKEDMIFNMLADIGITTISYHKNQVVLTSQHIKMMIDARNKLVHKNSKIPDNLLWVTVFPLVTKIVELLLKDPDCLS